MTWQVSGEYTDFQKPNLKGNFYLNADQVFNFQTWSPPINWKGFVGGQDVRFIQLMNPTYLKDSFDRSRFPAELDFANAINEAMKTMD